jgi:hypothetical protein
VGARCGPPRYKPHPTGTLRTRRTLGNHANLIGAHLRDLLRIENDGKLLETEAALSLGAEEQTEGVGGNRTETHLHLPPYRLLRIAGSMQMLEDMRRIPMRSRY